jgi:hypothetical protein
MSYERVKVLDVQPKADRQTGEVSQRVSFEMVVRGSFSLKGEAMALQPDYEALKGQMALVPLRAGVFDDGRQYWVLGTDGDGLPLPIAQPKAADTKPASLFPGSKTGTNG